MALRGARETAYDTFRGVCLDTDPLNLPRELAASLANVDVFGDTLRVRRGTEAFGTIAVVGQRPRGLIVHYPVATARKVIMQAGTAIYEDDGAGGWTSPVTGLTGGEPCDFVDYRGVIYAGNGIDALRKRAVGGSWSVVANLAAPGTAPTVVPTQAISEGFNSGTWTVSGSGLAWTASATPTLGQVGIRTADPREGAGALYFNTNSALPFATYVYKAWSGGNQDLSGAESLVFWVRANAPRAEVQVVVYANGETPGSSAPQWDKVPVVAVGAVNQWLRVAVPLAGIPRANRTASPGLAIRVQASGHTGIWVDDLKLDGGIAPDTYRYQYTYHNSSTLQESPPSSAGVLEIAGNTPAQAISVQVTGTATAGVDFIRIYRRRDHGSFRRARLVASIANPGATTTSYSDTRSDGALAEEAAGELVVQRADPPRARCMGLVNHRLLLGDVTISGVRYPQRLYLSRQGRPEQFGTEEEPQSDPGGPGWIDLPDKDPIRRILEVDGQALIFTDRSVYSLEGSQWDGDDAFRLARRLSVGLVGRWAVAVVDRLVYFLAGDGVRVLVPNAGVRGEYPSWVISEPVRSRIRATPSATLALAAMGVDERGRVHLAAISNGAASYTSGLIFDPQIPEALSQNENPMRPGWVIYDGWDFGIFAASQVAGGDNGELFAGSLTTGRVWRLQQTSTAGVPSDLTLDAGQSIVWHWESGAAEPATGDTLEVAYVGITADASPTAITGELRMDGTLHASTVSLTPSGSGVVSLEKRTAVGVRGQRGAVRLSGTHPGGTLLRNVRLGYYTR